MYFNKWVSFEKVNQCDDASVFSGILSLSVYVINISTLVEVVTTSSYVDILLINLNNLSQKC